MRRLVPDRNEVANLMDEISTRAKIRGSRLQFCRCRRSRSRAFETYRYQYSIMGRYDQLGEFSRTWRACSASSSRST
jgi:Tfp pilus assembly protein PilO